MTSDVPVSPLPDDLTPAKPHTAGQERLARSAVSSFGWSLVSFGGSKLIVFLATLVLARVLDPADFGLVAAGLVLVAYFEVALDLGLGAALVYEQERGLTRRVHTAFTLNAAVAVVLTTLGVLLAPAIAAFFGVPGQDNLFRAMFLYLLIRGLGQVQEAVLKRDLAFGRRTLVTVLSASVRAALSIGLAFGGFGAWSLVVGILGGQLVMTLMSSLLIRFRPRLVVEPGALRQLLGYGLTYLALKMVDALSENIDYLVVGVRLGPEALGLYSMAYRLPELVIASLLWIFSTVAFPVYSRARAEGPGAFRSIMLRALTLTTLFGFTAGVGLALIARDAVLVLFSAKWSPAAVPMSLVALAIGISAIGYASGDIFPALGRPGALLAFSVPMTAVELVAFVLAAPHGIIAVAWVHLAYLAVYSPARLVIANRLVGTTMRDCLVALRPALCSAAGVAAAGLPLRLMLQPGLLALVAISVAGVLGAVAGLLAGGPGTVRQVRALRHALASAR